MEENGRGNEAGSPESAASYVGRGGAGTPRHEESYSVRSARSRAEESRVFEWATRVGKLGGKIPTPEDRGGEHTVSYDPKSNRYFKATRPEANLGFGIALTDSGLGATPAEYLHRLFLNNQLFGDDVRIEWVVRPGIRPVIVTSQPYVKGPPASPRQIVGRMLAGGFYPIAPGAFYSEEAKILAFDVYPKNVKFTDGKVVLIDPVLQCVIPEFVQFIRRNYQHLPDFQNVEAQKWNSAC